MFTVIAFFGIAAIATLVSRLQDREALGGRHPSLYDDDQVREAIIHARQDLKLIAYLLAGVIIMLGIVADRIR